MQRRGYVIYKSMHYPILPSRSTLGSRIEDYLPYQSRPDQLERRGCPQQADWDVFEGQCLLQPSRCLPHDCPWSESAGHQTLCLGLSVLGSLQSKLTASPHPGWLRWWPPLEASSCTAQPHLKLRRVLASGVGGGGGGGILLTLKRHSQNCYKTIYRTFLYIKYAFLAVVRLQIIWLTKRASTATSCDLAALLIELCVWSTLGWLLKIKE